MAYLALSSVYINQVEKALGAKYFLRLKTACIIMLDIGISVSPGAAVVLLGLWKCQETTGYFSLSPPTSNTQLSKDKIVRLCVTDP